MGYQFSNQTTNLDIFSFRICKLILRCR